MRVTVAVPCYNGASHVGGAIEAVLSQTVAPAEVLVIDDGSTDESATIARRYPVRLVRHGVNRGLAVARNTALQVASGNVIVYVDADAYADPGLLATMVRPYEDGTIGGVGGQGIEANVSSTADRWRQVHASQGYGGTAKDVEFLFGLCMSYRTTLLRDIGGFDTSFSTNAEDMDIGLRVRAAGYRLLYIPEACVYHQRRDTNSSLRRTMRRWYSAAYRARRKNHAQAWRLLAGTLRRCVTDPVQDIVAHRDPSLVPLSVTIASAKLLGLADAILHGAGNR